MVRRIVLLTIAAAIVGGIAYAAWAYFKPVAVESVEPPLPPPVAGALPTPAEFERLVREDPVAMIKACLDRYQLDGNKGFTATLEKQECVKGKLSGREVIRLTGAGELPENATDQSKFRIRMIWESGFPEMAFIKSLATLYVTGENKNRMLTLTSIGFVKSFDPKESMPRDSSRYSIADAGLYRGMFRTFDAWEKRKAAGTLNASYLGIQHPEQLGGRACYAIQRKCPAPEVDPFALDEKPDLSDPDRDGAVEVTIYIDVELWIQTGTVLKRADGSPLADYWFRDIKLSKQNFEPNPFTMDAVRAAVKR